MGRRCAGIGARASCADASLRRGDDLGWAYRDRPRGETRRGGAVCLLPGLCAADLGALCTTCRIGRTRGRDVVWVDAIRGGLTLKSLATPPVRIAAILSPGAREGCWGDPDDNMASATPNTTAVPAAATAMARPRGIAPTRIQGRPMRCGGTSPPRDVRPGSSPGERLAAGPWRASCTSAERSPQKSSALGGASAGRGGASAPKGTSSSRGPSQSRGRRITLFAGASPVSVCASLNLVADLFQRFLPMPS